MQQMQQMHFAFSSYSSFTSLSWSVRYTYPGVLNGRDIKQREATRKYKKQKKSNKTQHDRSNRSNKRNKGQVHHTLAAAFVGVGQILFLKMHGLTCLFSFRTHHHRKGCHGCCLGCQSVEEFLFFSTSLETCNRKSFVNTVRTSP